MVYVHVPFCRSFCTYCDFYSEIRRQDFLEPYVDSLVREAVRRREEIEESSAVNTLYFGGGTPSVLPLSAFSRIVQSIGGGPFDEFTVEVNPDDIVSRGEGFLDGLRSLGVNRISMGVQSLDDGMLRWMNRRHNARGAGEAFKMLREAGFSNVSLDVIYGVSGMSESSLVETLRGIALWEPEHISAYQLSIEEGSTLCQMVRDGRYVELDESSCRRQYEIVCRELSRAGYGHYEISNWAREGFEAVHNSAYWTRAPYVGLGPGAHSLRIAGGRQLRSWNSHQLPFWACEGTEELTVEQIRMETLMLGLRTAEGVCGKRIPERDWFIADSIIADLI